MGKFLAPNSLELSKVEEESLDRILTEYVSSLNLAEVSVYMMQKMIN